VQRDNWRLRWHLSADRDPELSDVAALVPEDCQIVLDVKERTADRRAALLAALIAAELDPARFLVCAGHPDDLATLRAAGLPTWRSVGRAAQLDDLLAGGRTADEAASVRHTLLTESTVARLHERVRSVVAWTVNRPARAASLRGIGVDGITTDRATVIRAMAARPN
jgi:glycerophosphoryl diester phosphodiesterase